MSKSKNLGGFITIPIPKPSNLNISLDEYKSRYGMDLRDVMEDTGDRGVGVFPSRFIVNKPILTEDIDGYFTHLPRIGHAIVKTVNINNQNETVIIHGDTSNEAIGLYVDWANQKVMGYEIP